MKSIFHSLSTAGLALAIGACGTTSSVDRQLELLETQFSQLERHSVPRGPATGPPKPSGALPVVKLHKLKRVAAGGWEGPNAIGEPEVRVDPTTKRRYDTVQRPRAGVAGMDANGNLVDADGKIVYRAGKGSPERAAEARTPTPRRVWEPRKAPTPEQEDKGIKPMPRLKQFRIGGSKEIPLDRGDHIRVETAPSAPPVPSFPEADEPEVRVKPRPAPAVRPARVKAAPKKRIAKKAPRVQRARWKKGRSKPVPKIRNAPQLRVVKATPAPAVKVVPKRRSAGKVKAAIKPMPKLRRAPKKVRAAKRKPVPTLEIKRAPGPQRVTKQRSYKGAKERRVKALYKRALAAFYDGNDEAASRDFKKLLRSYYTHDLADNALYWLGETTYRSGQWVQALSYFQDVIIRYPDGNKVGDAMVKSALCYANLGDTSYAQKVLADVESLFPASPVAKVARQRRLAMGQGDPG